MIIYISFCQGTKESDIDKAVNNIIQLPLLTMGQWGDGSGTCSLIDILKKKVEQSILVIPQAALVCSLKDGGKRLSYGDQCEKNEAKRLYHYFLRQLRIICADKLDPERVKKNS
eukprot:UN26052